MENSEERVSPVRGQPNGDCCSCCPYGFHIDLDFLKFLDSATNDHSFECSSAPRKFHVERVHGSVSEVTETKISHDDHDSVDLREVEENDQARIELMTEIDTSIQTALNTIDLLMKSDKVKSSKQSIENKEDRLEARCSPFKTNNNSLISETNRVHEFESCQNSVHGDNISSADFSRVTSLNGEHLVLISASTLQSIRQQIANSLSQIKELEEEVKSIPSLKSQIASLIEFKDRNIGKGFNTQSIGVGANLNVPHSSISTKILGSENAYKYFSGVQGCSTLPKVSFGYNHTTESTDLLAPTVKELTKFYKTKFAPKVPPKPIRSIGVGDGNVFGAENGTRLSTDRNNSWNDVENVDIKKKQTKDVGVMCKSDTKDVSTMHCFQKLLQCSFCRENVDSCTVCVSNKSIADKREPSVERSIENNLRNESDVVADRPDVELDIHNIDCSFDSRNVGDSSDFVETRCKMFDLEMNSVGNIHGEESVHKSSQLLGGDVDASNVLINADVNKNPGVPEISPLANVRHLCSVIKDRNIFELPTAGRHSENNNNSTNFTGCNMHSPTTNIKSILKVSSSYRTDDNFNLPQKFSTAEQNIPDSSKLRVGCTLQGVVNTGRRMKQTVNGKSTNHAGRNSSNGKIIGAIENGNCLKVRETGLRSPSSSEDDMSEEDDDDDDISSSSFDEGSYDGRIGRITYVCTDDNKKVSFRTEQSEYQLDDDFMKACLEYSTFLTGSLSHLSEAELDSCLQTIRLKWFQVSSQRSSRTGELKLYLSAISRISSKLLQDVINMIDSNGNTALHHSVTHNNMNNVCTLLDTSVCDVDKMNHDGYTAAMLASLTSVGSDADWIIIRRLFISSNINIKSQHAGKTALMFATGQGCPIMVKLLLDLGAEVNAQDNDGVTALMCASEHGHEDIVALLLSRPQLTNGGAEENCMR